MESVLVTRQLISDAKRLADFNHSIPFEMWGLPGEIPPVWRSPDDRKKTEVLTELNFGTLIHAVPPKIVHVSEK